MILERQNNLRSLDPSSGSRFPPSIIPPVFHPFFLCPPPALWAGPGESCPAALLGGEGAQRYGQERCGSARFGAVRSREVRNGAAEPNRRRKRGRAAAPGQRPDPAELRGESPGGLSTESSGPGGDAPGEAAGPGRGGEWRGLRAASPGLLRLREKRVEKLVLPSQKLSLCVRMPGVRWEAEGGAGRGG